MTESLPIAFYAPLKPPDHPHPSGDRQLARLLISALTQAGYRVTLASRFRSYDRYGDTLRQQRLQQLGSRLADRLIRRYRALPSEQRPRLWFSYHLYHKAPDWLGPRVSQALGIPYVTAEASYAPSQRSGPWRTGFMGAEQALQQARLCVCLNPVDRHCLEQQFPHMAIADLAPFIETGQMIIGAATRQQLARQWGLHADRPWLISVAMMRPGDKTRSYRLLADALGYLSNPDWQLLVIGDGINAGTVRDYFASFPQVRFLGCLNAERITPLLSASDLLVWPAVNEAFGMSLLEAQWAGTPVLAGNEGGVASIVADGISGVLVPPRDPRRFAEALAGLLDAPERLADMGVAARRYLQDRHSLDSAAKRLSNLLRGVL